MPGPIKLAEVSKEISDRVRERLAARSSGPLDTRGYAGNAHKKAKGDGRGRGGPHIRARARLPDEPTARSYYDVGEIPDGMKNCLLTMLKTHSNAQQRLRIVESTTADNYLVPSSHPAFITAMIQQEAYAEAVRKNPTTHGFKGAAMQIFVALAEALLTCEVGEKNRDRLKAINARIEKTTSPTKVHNFVSYLKLTQSHDPQYMKLVLVSADTEIRSAIQDTIEQIKDSTFFTGPAPPTGQEDELQKWITSITSSLE